MNQPFQKIKHEEIYHGKVINVCVDTVRYKDKNIKWEIVEQGNSVVVLPMIDNNTFLLIHQYRYTVREYIWELPAGRAHHDETLELCAQRELEEECCYRARSIKKLLTYYPSPGVSTEIMHLFFAMDLYEARGACPDDDEIIRTVTLPIDTIEDMINKGEIRDAKTILAFLYFKVYKHNLL